MGISAPRLRQSRHGVFVFRYLVPPEFQEKLGKKELRRSLRTKNAAAARLLGLNLNVVIERLLKYAERIFSRPAYIEALTPSEKVMRK